MSSYDPYAAAFPAAAFTLASTDFAGGAALPDSAYAETGNTLPDLRWSGMPQGTRSFVATAFDADAPVPGGLWHWLVKDIPEEATGLTGGGSLPEGAVQLPNSLGYTGYSGAQPPPGTGTHRMFLCVTALDVPVLELPEGASAALLNICMIPHTLGRALLVGTATPRV